MRLVVIVAILFIIFSFVKNINIDVGDAPVSEYIIDKVSYKPCRFTIRYDPGLGDNQIFVPFKKQTLPLDGLESISEEECKCIEDALKEFPDGMQQFRYADKPRFLVKINNNKFDITVRVKGYDDKVRELNFNKIANENLYDICGKWTY